MNINDLMVKDNVDFTQKYTSGFEFADDNAGELDLEGLPIEIDIANIDLYPNKEYALLRKNGLGTSDSSIVLGVNPYTSLSDLIREKCRDYLTDDELAVGDKSAVRKGRELEPLIIHKHSQVMGRRIIKPIHMYNHKDFPYIKFNFDGVLDKTYIEDGVYKYIPDEIKVVTIYGMKHYQKHKATYSESVGWRDIPPKYCDINASIEDKAAMYGIPPYYYTQLQQQIFGLDAPYGFLTVLFEKDWEMHSWLVWRDQKLINELVLQDTKTWNTIETRRPSSFELDVTIRSPRGTENEKLN